MPPEHFSPATPEEWLNRAQSDLAIAQAKEECVSKASKVLDWAKKIIALTKRAGFAVYPDFRTTS
ncbi:MAG: hypothetical protein J7L73_07390 [Anaerolineales bacterium]|nr:hypothetical protein [Anaerolineales bacterium]